MWSSITLEFVGECHGRSYTCIATQAFVIITEVIRTAWTIFAVEHVVGIAVWALQAHAQAKCDRDYDAHNENNGGHLQVGLGLTTVVAIT